ncbi:hypothetical protein Q7P37_001767 [Cladosporium fusiforme]
MTASDSARAESILFSLLIGGLLLVDFPAAARQYFILTGVFITLSDFKKQVLGYLHPLTGNHGRPTAIDFHLAVALLRSIPADHRREFLDSVHWVRSAARYQFLTGRIIDPSNQRAAVARYLAGHAPAAIPRRNDNVIILGTRRV